MKWIVLWRVFFLFSAVWSSKTRRASSTPRCTTSVRCAWPGNVRRSTASRHADRWRHLATDPDRSTCRIGSASPRATPSDSGTRPARLTTGHSATKCVRCWRGWKKIVKLKKSTCLSSVCEVWGSQHKNSKTDDFCIYLFKVWNR